MIAYVDTGLRKIHDTLANETNRCLQKGPPIQKEPPNESPQQLQTQNVLTYDVESTNCTKLTRRCVRFANKPKNKKDAAKELENRSTIINGSTHPQGEKNGV